MSARRSSITVDPKAVGPSNSTWHRDPVAHSRAESRSAHPLDGGAIAAAPVTTATNTDHAKAKTTLRVLNSRKRKRERHSPALCAISKSA